MQPFSPRYKGAGFYSTDHRKATARACEPIQVAPAKTRSSRGFAADEQRQRNHELLPA